ncbi:hypothetical protein RBG61_12360 [Paludicola sp. MB14-C6]|uniref:hypothetical protein n=1 Tax=Paludihabitans sp. MB14-C6 TaxID=3070656 RepID=UPI0027DBC9D3|nr:hypothetical protein [Paludicola sp. MB14-C6]WMJ22773.1 hypothetical protein RBG61_12360 [Paludicola sp. MB14-C6]
MKKRLFSIILICTCCLLFSCNTHDEVKHFLWKTPKKILIKEGGENTSWFPSNGEVLDSLEKLVIHSDLIVHGTVKTATSMYHDTKSNSFVSDISFRCKKTYLGSKQRTLKFQTCTGYLPTVLREKELSEQGLVKSFLDDFSEEKKENSYIEIREFNGNIMMPKDEYILFMQKNDDGSYNVLKDMKVVNSYGDLKYNQHSYQIKDVIDYLSSIDQNNIPICGNCNRLRKK